MVKLSILSYKGNSNSRFFPHSGYLGLTPVKVDGVIRTTLDEDRKPLLASSIQVSVACIEARLGRVGVMHSSVHTEYTQILWMKPDSVEWEELGDAEHAFKIVIPANSPGFSFANFQDYRVFWRIEAVINHAPIFGIGSRKLKTYEIPLVRYDAHVQCRRPLHSSARYLTTQIPHAPVIRYQLLTPTTPVGPLDIVTIPLILHPVDPAVAVRSVTLIVERRIELHETPRPPSGQPWERHSPQLASAGDRNTNSRQTPHGYNHDRHPDQDRQGESSTNQTLKPPPAHASAPLISLSSANSVDSLSTTNEQRPLLTPIMTDLPAKTVSLTVAHVESSGVFMKDSTGIYSKSLTLHWPANKSNSHWAMGETMQTEMINVRFFIHVKIIVSSPTTGTETIELEERELFLIATNESERNLAATKYADASARSKSKSPRRSKLSRSPFAESPENQLPPTPILPVPQTAPLDNRSSCNLHYSPRASPMASTSPATLRRPHTSGGSRDKANSRSHHRHHEHHRDRDRNKEDENPGKFSAFRSTRRPETALPAVAIPLASKDSSSSAPSSYPYPSAHARRSSREAIMPCSPSGGSLSDPGTVRAWEEELARIELTSRRVSANMLGFNLKRPRARSARPKTASSSLTSNSP
ncbi:hypothetical protein EW145_g5064 [Phellinidium pouzarii]|uniref:Uncharacterized protein n=1 Tax=Phellinidium pouzarii TaxID=167371 RepID=A0A4S4L1A7_9AGAM|nr:hypothetical protein EW145_g5064 [Phellinidium pouzarii]